MEVTFGRYLEPLYVGDVYWMYKSRSQGHYIVGSISQNSGGDIRVESTIYSPQVKIVVKVYDDP